MPVCGLCSRTHPRSYRFLNRNNQPLTAFFETLYLPIEYWHIFKIGCRISEHHIKDGGRVYHRKYPGHDGRGFPISGRTHVVHKSRQTYPVSSQSMLKYWSDVSWIVYKGMITEGHTYMCMGMAWYKACVCLVFIYFSITIGWWSPRTGKRIAWDALEIVGPTNLDR